MNKGIIETRLNGKCSGCETPITKIINSIQRTCRADGIRYIYTLKPDEGWGIFRCDTCSSVIDEVWIPEVE